MPGSALDAEAREEIRAGIERDESLAETAADCYGRLSLH